MNPARESVADGALPRLEVSWPGRPIDAGTTTRPLDFGGPDGRTARAALRSWAAGRYRAIVGGRQVHGSRVRPVDREAVPEAVGGDPPIVRLEGVDGFTSATPGILLTVGVADCVPALVYAPSVGALALLHAGWRGVAAGILERAVERMVAEYGVEPRDCVAWWGPAVGPCCYPVGEEVVEAIRATVAGPGTEGWVRPGSPGPRVDLRAALTRQALAAGLPNGAVTASPRCTSCEKEAFHSYRRDGVAAGRMIAYAGVPIG